MTIMSKRIAVILFVLFANQAHALQIKEVYEGVEIHANISSNDINRIKVIDDKIRSVRGNAGEIEITKDPELGEVYIRVAKRGYKKPINLFVTTEKNSTYKLLLSPVSIPSEQIFLRNLTTTTEIEKNKTPSSYKQKLIALYKSMSGQDGGYKNFDVKNLKGKYDLTEALEVKNLKRYQGEDFRGDVIEIKNSSSEDIFFNEDVFKGRGVAAVKIDSMLLAPKEKTLAYVISR